MEEQQTKEPTIEAIKAEKKALIDKGMRHAFARQGLGSRLFPIGAGGVWGAVTTALWFTTMWFTGHPLRWGYRISIVMLLVSLGLSWYGGVAWSDGKYEEWQFTRMNEENK